MSDRAVAALARVPDAARARAMAEAAEWTAMLAVCDVLEAEYELIGNAQERHVALSSIPLEIAVVSGWSEHQVQLRLSAAKRVRARLGRVWIAFANGRLDAARVMAISHTLEKLTRDSSVEALDATVVAYAADHTVSELKAWLRRFVAKTEPDQSVQRATAEREDRYVLVTHVDDAMAYLSAYIPSVLAAAIDTRLTKQAQAMHGDERTVEQRRADLLMAWMTNHDTDTAAVGTDVAVVVPAEVLAGASDELAVASDGSWISPASWLLDYAGADQIYWHRLLHTPASGVLDYTYLGRFAPEHLQTALRFRDRVCRAPGCTRDARHCDQDHLEPWPSGPTSGRNMGALCRRHHRMKSHGYLTWRLPSGHEVHCDPHGHDPPQHHPASNTEAQFTKLIIEYDG